MSSSARTVLDALLEDARARTAPTSTPSDFFELFSAEQVLKNYGLSYEEIASGIVGHEGDARGGDGGIDSIYTFVNGLLATDDTIFDNLRESVTIHAVIIQSKTVPGFAEGAVSRLADTARDLLDPSHDLANYKAQYNASLLRSVATFRRAFQALAAQLPQIRFSYYYATKAEGPIHPSVRHRRDQLVEVVLRLFTGSSCEVHFIGAEQLLALVRKSKSETLPLEVAEAMPTQAMGTICLVRLKDYYSFVADRETGELRSWLFEENVRDYEGRNIDVNRGIRSTLEHPTDDVDFWWLNNGITVVASAAPMAGKTLTLDSPKVVNGLQTSIEVFNHFLRHPEADDDRAILVRVVVTEDEKTRNDIIRATNSQSAIKAASLRAFDEIQHRIEQYFLARGLFYDRRKNYYKNLGNPRDKIVGITYLAQAVVAIVLQRPNDSRGRPTSLIKNDTEYARVFSLQYPIELYYECARFMHDIDAYLESDQVSRSIRGNEINVKFHTAMFAAAMKAKRLRVTPAHIQKKGLGQLPPEYIATCVRHVWEVLRALKKSHRIDEDQIAKSPEFDQAVKDRLRRVLVTKEIPFADQ